MGDVKKGGDEDGDWASVAAEFESVRWNAWVRVQPVQLEGETRPVPRPVRLSCTAARVGDAVRVRDGRRWIGGRITAVRHSVLHIAVLPGEGQPSQ